MDCDSSSPLSMGSSILTIVKKTTFFHSAVSYTHLTISTNQEAETHVGKLVEEAHNEKQSQYIEEDDARSLDQ